LVEQAKQGVAAVEVLSLCPTPEVGLPVVVRRDPFVSAAMQPAFFGVWSQALKTPLS
jgi:hypothetical protein